jgi:hypothetical protein
MNKLLADLSQTPPSLRQAAVLPNAAPQTTNSGIVVQPTDQPTNHDPLTNYRSLTSISQKTRKKLIDGTDTFNSRNHYTLMQIFVKGLSGKILTMEVKPTDLVGEVWERFAEKEGLPGPHRWAFAGRILYDEFTLQAYGIQEGSELHVLLTLRRHPDSPIRLVLNLEGRPLTVEVGTTSTFQNVRIGEVKKAIEHEHGIRREDQRLFFQGTELEDEHTMGDYSMGHEALVGLVPRRGILGNS